MNAYWNKYDIIMSSKCVSIFYNALGFTASFPQSTHPYSVLSDIYTTIYEQEVVKHEHGYQSQVFCLSQRQSSYNGQVLSTILA